MKYSKDSDVITQGESINIPVTVSDENGDALNLTGAGLTGYKLPNFVTFTDNGNGTGVFHLAPGGNTVAGDHTIYLTATEQRSYSLGEEHSTIGNFLVTVNAGVGVIPDVVTPPVVRAVNHRPNLTPLPLQLGYENRSLTFELKGNDGDGDALVYTIDQVTKDGITVAIPKGVFINPNTGRFFWNTDYNQAGHYNFKFSTLDPSGLKDSKDVVVWIENVNRSPLFEPSNRAVSLGKELKFLLGGSDPDLNTTLSYKAIDLPTGSSLDSNTGEFKWIPDAAQVGVHNVTFTISDGEETVKRIVTIKVRNQIDAPKLSIDLTPGCPVRG
jgi:Putative Ig domain